MPGLRISIHAPTRGATVPWAQFDRDLKQFQSTLPQGERLPQSWRKLGRLENFNPRSHKGSDGGRPSKKNSGYISIHAPTRGATDTIYSVDFCTKISIHAPTRGATCWFQDPASECRFQSTLPQGERRFFHGGICPVCDFNPRSHKGSDFFPPPAIIKNIGFQSTLPQGERRRGSASAASRLYFNPRSHKGSDICRRCKRLGREYFNPRSHKGSDSRVSNIAKNPHRFQSTLPQGERHRYRYPRSVTRGFQSTLPQGERHIQ